MSPTPLGALREAGYLAPLSEHFARFMAQGCGVDADSLLAWTAALVSHRNLQGDVCVDLARFSGRTFFDGCEAGLSIPEAPPLKAWLAALRQAPWVGTPDHLAPLVLDGRRLYLGAYWRFEQRVAQALHERSQPIASLDDGALRRGLDRLFPPLSDSIDWQRLAAALAVSRGVTVISGGPGTGKTTTVVKVLALLLEQDPQMRIALAAPTGKAAARLTESIRTGRVALPVAQAIRDSIPTEAATLQRLLGKRPLHHGYEYDRENPLFLDCLVVDEASMIDLPLMARLLDALPNRSRLILLGDRDQLASVEAGNVLGDITGHGKPITYSATQCQRLEALGAVPRGSLDGLREATPHPADGIALLRVSYRFREESGIGALAKAVNRGQGERALDWIRSDPESLGWIEAQPNQLHPECLDWAVARYRAAFEQEDVRQALAHFSRYRVLAALRQGPFGVETINRLLEARLNAQGWIESGEEYSGKPILITVNAYEVGLFNGDMGILWREPDGRLRAYFQDVDGRLRALPVRQLPPYEPAFALSVHKSQGSEFDEILLVLPPEPAPLVTRELLYTGITRARTRVWIHGSRAGFLGGCQRRVQRASALGERLGWR